MPLSNLICPICDSEYVLYCQDVIGARTKKLFPQYFCMDCKSFFHKSNYHEDVEQKRNDFECVLGLRDHHKRLFGQLFLEIKYTIPWIRNVLEIGHGSGAFLEVVRDYGCFGHGFEVNQYCHEFARDQLGLSVEFGYFGSDHAATYDLICAIMVFEHLENPRALFCHMRSKLNRGGAIYISVPFVERREWPFLRTAGTIPGGSLPDPFFDNDVHIAHFSVEGMKRMGISLGARSAEFFVSKDVVDHSPGSYPGVLFQF